MLRKVSACLLLLLLVGCASLKQGCSRAKSATVGLQRRVVLFDCYGKPIAEWTGTFYVIDEGGSCRFMTTDGRAVRISGTWVVEELR